MVEVRVAGRSLWIVSIWNFAYLLKNLKCRAYRFGLDSHAVIILLLLPLRVMRIIRRRLPASVHAVMHYHFIGKLLLHRLCFSRAYTRPDLTTIKIQAIYYSVGSVYPKSNTDWLDLNQIFILRNLVSAYAKVIRSIQPGVRFTTF